MTVKEFFGNWIVKNLLIAVTVILILSFGSYFLLDAVTQHNREISVPDMTGLDVHEAQELAHLHGMRVDVTDSVYVRRMARGCVYRQKPEAGSKVKKGRRIILTINAVNPKKATMPNLIGYSMRQAKAELSSRGLNLGRLIYVEDIATNNVLKQLHRNREIEPGVKIESESVIDLVVGLNDTDNLTYIPLLTGTRYMNAIDAIHDNSLNVKAVIFDNTVKDYNDSLNAVVFKQIPDTSAIALPMGSEMVLHLTTDRNKLLQQSIE